MVQETQETVLFASSSSLCG